MFLFLPRGADVFSHTPILTLVHTMCILVRRGEEVRQLILARRRAPIYLVGRFRAIEDLYHQPIFPALVTTMCTPVVVMSSLTPITVALTTLPVAAPVRTLWTMVAVTTTIVGC